MNFIFVSPHFPKTYWNFCDRLKKRGVNVLGIGDCPYDALAQNVKDSLNEYYYVSDLADYSQMYCAVAFFASKYGRIDWLESNNEFWLESDARLRTDFNIHTGAMNDFIGNIKYKSRMKASYERAGVPVARYHMVSDLESGREFVNKVGYPVIVKPDNGCGAEATYKLKNERDLCWFYSLNVQVPYIMEEFINGTIVSFDGIAGDDSVPVFYTSNYFPTPLIDVVSSNGHLAYWTVKDVPEDLRDAGFRTVKAFGARNRFFHLEFFRLNEDKDGMGKKGDVVALEVNMRPAGGYTPDMINYANSVDCYDIWADMVVSGGKMAPVSGNEKYFCVYASQRDGRPYHHDKDAIMAAYGDRIVMQERMPEALALDMGNNMYTARLNTEEEKDEFLRFVQGEGEYEYIVRHSGVLGRDMRTGIYGHGGKVLIDFATQNGKHNEFADYGMIRLLSPWIESGRLTVVTTDSIDEESWSDVNGDPAHRCYMQESWFRHITDEVLPMVREKTGYSGKFLATGCSMGGFHAANFMFRRPDLFDGCLALSGAYDMTMFVKNYFGENFVNNSPVHYMPMLPWDHPYHELYRQSHIILCSGQGAWEDELLIGNREFKRILEEKGISARFEYWGYDVAHDWPWWRKQLPYYMEQLLN